MKFDWLLLLLSYSLIGLGWLVKAPILFAIALVLAGMALRGAFRRKDNKWYTC